MDFHADQMGHMMGQVKNHMDKEDVIEDSINEELLKKGMREDAVNQAMGEGLIDEPTAGELIEDEAKFEAWVNSQE